MALIVTFEEMEGWKKARELNKQIYEITSRGRFYALKDQIRRSSISIMANLAEGLERNTTLQKNILQMLRLAQQGKQDHIYALPKIKTILMKYNLIYFMKMSKKYLEYSMVLSIK